MACKAVILGGLVLGFGLAMPSLVGAANDSGASEPQQIAVEGQEQVITKPTENFLPGNRLVTGRIISIRANQIEIDIGNPQSLYVPLRPAKVKGQTFKVGEPIIVTLNDHNAIVDYHHPNERADHQVVRGKLTTPLTVGLDKAVIETEQGTKTFIVTDRAKGKLTTIPIGADAYFLADETGQLVDAQLASAKAVQKSAENNKARIKGAHKQVKAVFKGAEQPSASGPSGGEGRLKIIQHGQEREVPFRPPLKKLDRLHEGQEVVLLMDDRGYVLEIATPDVRPTR